MTTDCVGHDRRNIGMVQALGKNIGNIKHVAAAEMKMPWKKMQVEMERHCQKVHESLEDQRGIGR